MTAAFARSASDGEPGANALGEIDTSLGRDEYIRAVERAKDAIAAGEAIQVVLARRQSFDLPAGPDGQPDRRHRPLSRAPPGQPEPVPVLHPDPGRWRSSARAPSSSSRSPGERLTTHPIAGTRPRGATPAEDDRLADELQRDPKERAEHVMLVDLGRNDLGRVARPGTVTTSQYMEVEQYSHVLHLVSHVEAKLRPDLDALDALRAVFPAGTLTGAPKVRAMQLIAAAEGERRGLYGGAVGYLGYDGNLDTAITIRSAVLKDGQAHVHTGAGIVAGSVPGDGVRGDRAQGGGDAPGDRAGGRARRAAPDGRRPRRAEPRRRAPR